MRRLDAQKRSKQLRFQRSEGGLRAAFLEVGKRCIKNQKPCYDRRFKVLVQHQLENYTEFEQSWKRCPEFDQHISQRVSGCVGIAFGPSFSSRLEASSLVKPTRAVFAGGAVSWAGGEA